MLWIPVTLAAAFLQNIRSALQKILKSQLSDMGATYVRFVYAWPFAIAFLALLVFGFDIAMPRANLAFVLWVIAASVSQIINTFLLLWLFSFSNFAVGTAYSKTEVVQVAMLELILLDQTTSWIGAGAIVLSTIGVLVISAGKAKLSVANLARGLGQKSTLIGLTCGLVLGASAVLFRGATLALEHESVLAKAAYTAAVATVLQTGIMTVWLRLREPGQITLVMRQWRTAGAVGFVGWLGSLGWFTAFALTNAAYVRALGQIELVFSYLSAVFFFRERVTRIEVIGIAMLVLGIVALVLERSQG